MLHIAVAPSVVMLHWEPNSGDGGTTYIVQYRLDIDLSDPAFNATFITAATVSPSI